MKTLIWIVQVLVAIAFLGAGFMKFLTPYNELIADPNMAWAVNFNSTQIMIISVLEILGALGLILPMIIKRFRILVPLAAIGLALIMVGAIITHLGRSEPVIANIILLTLTILTAWWRRSFFKR